jgi:hypothetical protein
MNCDELRIEIRRVLGVSIHPNVSSDPRSGTRRVVDSLNHLDESQLTKLLKLTHATVAIDLNSGDERREGWGRFAGEDSLQLVRRITTQELSEALILGQEGVQLPQGMRVKDALWTVRDLESRFLATTPELVNAHLYVAHNLRQKHSKGYTLEQMTITQNHPEKAITIVALAGRNPYIKESDVVRHHGVEPVLFDGVL